MKMAICDGIADSHISEQMSGAGVGNPYRPCVFTA